MTQIGEEQDTGSTLSMLRRRILAFASCEVSDRHIWVPIMGPWAQAWAHHGPMGAQAWVHHGPMGGPSLGPSWAHEGPKLGPIMGPWGA
jgi:hypothetical protein